MSMICGPAAVLVGLLTGVPLTGPPAHHTGSAPTLQPALAGSWTARRPRKAKTKPTRPSAPVETVTAPADPFAGLNTNELIAAARLRLADLEYEQVARVTALLLARGDLDEAQRTEALWMQANAQAIMGDLLGAEKALRQLLQLRPEFEPPADTTPKIVAVLSKVQLEERAIREQQQRALRATLVATLSLTGGPGAAAGGKPMAFEFTAVDPRGAIVALTVYFRRPGDPGYSSLALTRTPEGTWTGAIPGEALVNDGGMSLSYYVVAQNGTGETLVSRGSAAAPLAAEVAAGRLEQTTPLYRSVWFWTAVVGVTAAASGTGFYFYNRQQAALPESDLGEFRLRR